MNRQRLLLAVVLILLAVAVVSAYLRWPHQQTVKTATTSSPRSRSLTAQKPGADTVPKVDDRFVRLDLLEQEGQRFSGFRRNIFRLAPPEGPHGGKPPVTVLKPPPPPANVPPVSPPMPLSPPVQRDMARFTFLGFLKKDGVQTVFLSKDNKIVLVKKGDRIEGKYEATGLTDDALTIRVLSDGTEVVIPLKENHPLITKH